MTKFLWHMLFVFPFLLLSTKYLEFLPWGWHLILNLAVVFCIISIVDAVVDGRRKKQME